VSINSRIIKLNFGENRSCLYHEAFPSIAAGRLHFFVCQTAAAPQRMGCFNIKRKPYRRKLIDLLPDQVLEFGSVKVGCIHPNLAVCTSAA
jgi:hypothetical protein